MSIFKLSEYFKGYDYNSTRYKALGEMLKQCKGGVIFEVCRNAKYGYPYIMAYTILDDDTTKIPDNELEVESAIITALEELYYENIETDYDDTDDSIKITFTE